MQRCIKVKTDYKPSREAKPSYYLPIAATKWKLSVALTLLTFVLLWKFNDWYSSYGMLEDNEQAWIESEQVTLGVDLPQHTVPALPSKEQLLSIEESNPWQTFHIKAGDSLGNFFQQSGVEAKALAEVLALRDAHHLKRIYPGQILKIQRSENGKLINLQFDIDPLTSLLVQRHPKGHLVSKMEEKPIEKRIAFGGSHIQDSFFVAGKQANLNAAMIMELANVFAYDIDFAQDIQPNDYFKVLFEEYFVNGVKVGNGPIVAAEFVNNGKHFRAIRYTDKAGNSSYYTPEGQSLKKAFIRTPVQFTRISSHFNLHRKHPILHKIRAHKGVDYAAPTGTPVKAAGQGKVIFVGQKGGYGNAIIIQHGPRYTTLYGHLSRFAKGIKQGMTVRQGQIIGNVGSSGLASGPHLHYEFRIDGVHRNPLTVPLPQAEGIPQQAKRQFLNYTHNLLHLMDNQHKVLVANNEF